MLSLIIGLIVLGIGLSRETPLFEALDYSLNVSWYLYATFSLLLVLIGLIMTVVGAVIDDDDAGKAGSTILIHSMVNGLIGIFGLSLVCGGITVTAVSNVPVVVVGSLLLLYASYGDRVMGKSLTNKD